MVSAPWNDHHAPVGGKETGMVPVHLEVEIPESRQVTLTLPPEMPTGRAHLAVTPADSAPTGVRYCRPSDPRTAAEFDDFMRLLPVLRAIHGEQFVAVDV